MPNLAFTFKLITWITYNHPGLFFFLSLFIKSLDNLCRQAENNSSLLLISADSGLNKMQNFSLRQSPHLSERGANGAPLSKIFQDISYFTFFLFSFQINLLRDVCWIVSFLNVWLCTARRALKSVEHRPVYEFLVWFSWVTVAW